MRFASTSMSRAEAHRVRVENSTGRIFVFESPNYNTQIRILDKIGNVCLGVQQGIPSVSRGVVMMCPQPCSYCPYPVVRSDKLKVWANEI